MESKKCRSITIFYKRMVHREMRRSQVHIVQVKKYSSIQVTIFLAQQYAVHKNIYFFIVLSFKFRYGVLYNKREEITHFSVQKCQALIDIFDFMYTHFAAIWFSNFLSRNNLEKFKQFHSISQIHKKVFDLQFCLCE